MSKVARALVTAGGTREPIDDVRAIANTSTGRFGVELARALAARGVDVALLASREAARLPGLDHPRITVATFESFGDLAARLEAACGAQPDLILMAAAVADYSPVPFAGKRPSDAPTWTLELTRNPKLLDRLRGWCPRARIVGFKLVSGVNRTARVELAAKQNRRAALDATVVNDARELAEDRHPVDLVPATGAPTSFAGSRQDVARGLASALVDPAAADPPSRELRAAGLRQRLHRHRPEIQQLLELPRALALAPDETCDIDDADEVLQALARASRAGRRGSASFALASLRGSVLLGLVDSAAYDQRERAIRLAATAADAGGSSHAMPILVGARAVGCVVVSDEGIGAAPYVAIDERGRGVGDLAIQALETRGLPLAASAASGLAPYYVARGYLPGVVRGSITTYVDPRTRADLVRAASVCLYEPRSQKVLVGRRLTPQWRDHWSFPGGVLEPGETELAAACRELREETGVEVELPYPVASATVYAARDTTSPVYRITNYLCYAPSATAPVATRELEAAWIPLGEVARLRPMAAGTRRVWTIYGLDRCGFGR